MYTLYCADISAFSLLQAIGEDKCVVLKNKSYRFYINRNNLLLDIISSDTNILYKTMEIEKNIKSDFDVHVQNDNIHIVVANKNYDLIYTLFDGESLAREIIYTFDRDIGIPSNPVIKSLDNSVHIIVSFIRFVKPRRWQIKSFSKTRGIWRKKLIDIGFGLCYAQPSLSSDSQKNIHCLYKHYANKSQNIKYACLNRDTLRWCKPEAICSNGINKYRPHIYINTEDRIYFLWLEISDQIYLCVADKNMPDHYDKLDITSVIQSITIWNDQLHIYAVSCEQNGFFYDLCCYKKESPHNITELPETKGEVDMDAAKVKLFLDIKRELEQCILEKEDALKLISRNNAEEIQDLLKENRRIKHELTTKNEKIEELSNTLNRQRVEINEAEYRQDVEAFKAEEIVKKRGNIESIKNALLHFLTFAKEKAIQVLRLYNNKIGNVLNKRNK